MSSGLEWSSHKITFIGNINNYIKKKVNIHRIRARLRSVSCSINHKVRMVEKKMSRCCIFKYFKYIKNSILVYKLKKKKTKLTIRKLQKKKNSIFKMKVRCFQIIYLNYFLLLF